ncbi:hypothetical protein D3C87_2029090 [compost metagenome]|uniref:Uncharacterized protein n=1 Tax=Paenibacillus riograndensis SBR5 TaxID=1073571 RepID=A0A0E4D000_9BACL|nr:hypothetical protein PRIO_6742 [Paenibacillus riograndensis SBR5]
MKEKVITQTNMSEKVIDKVFVVSKNKFHPEEETLSNVTHNHASRSIALHAADHLR